MQNTYLMVEKKKQPSLKFQNNTKDNLLKKNYICRNAFSNRLTKRDQSACLSYIYKYIST